ncbi:uncharacterized protein LOC128388463 isoform X1 [Panonychus citri]|uniref:uncharacterized protein LOC128388463 isoform X1 n=1 Tax=Panonychus citri TaxID=50023 RepID=UPI0023070882|nr:uncharacterized protein LOC128388463 isoform X1 [Panonychus citri]
MIFENFKPQLILIFCSIVYIANSNDRGKRTLWNLFGGPGAGGPIGGGGNGLSLPFPFPFGHVNMRNPAYPFFPNSVSDCPTGDGNRTGICVSNSFECRRRGGRALGNCYATPISGSGGNQRPDNSGIGFGSGYNPGIPVGVCCFLQVTCGGSILYNGTYFRNPNAPSPYTDSRPCSAQISNLKPDICQIRLDFLIFSLSQPTQGECDKDRFVVNGQIQNDVLPPMCGVNSGQHIYIDVAGTQGPVSLNFITTGHRSRQFDVRVTQIQCHSPYRAPAHCLQYHYDVVGRIMSLNFDLYNDGNTYFNNLDYTICFRKEPGFCTMTYSVPSERDPDEEPETNKPSRPSSVFRYFEIQPESKTSEAPGAGIVKCPSDYLMIGGIRFCGGRLNANVFANNPSGDTDVTDNSTGPIFARFVSDGKEVKRGFFLNYRMNPCFIGG